MKEKSGLLPSVPISDACMSTRATEIQSVLRNQSEFDSSGLSSIGEKLSKRVTFVPVAITKYPSRKGYTEKICAAIQGSL